MSTATDLNDAEQMDMTVADTTTGGEELALDPTGEHGLESENDIPNGREKVISARPVNGSTGA